MIGFMKRLLSGISILALLFVSTTTYFAQNSNVQLDNTASTTAAVATIKTAEAKAQSTELVDDIDEVIAQYSGLTISVSVTDIDNDYEYDAGESDTLFKGASTIKVLTAVYYMHQVEAGQTSLDTTISGVSAESLLQTMLQDSNNVSWAALINYLGSDNIEAYADSIGLDSFTGGNYNTITTADYVKLLAQLQDASLITAAHRDVLYSFMQSTDNELLIPSVLSSNMTVYHKWGTLWGNLHDVAIIDYQGHAYAIAIYTNSEDDVVGTVTQTAAIQQIMTVISQFITTG